MTVCATCRNFPAARMAAPAAPPEEDRALRLLGVAFPGAIVEPVLRWPICRTCIRQGGRYGVHLELIPLPTKGVR
jgi:hypothetical protein